MAGTISGGNAKKYANYARMGGVVLLVAATGLWAIPAMQELPQKPAPAPVPEEQPKTEASKSATPDMEQIADAGDRLMVAWTPAPKPVKVEVEQTGTTPVVEAGPEWTYLGPIKEADRCLAMVSVDGKQRIIGLGKKIGESKLVAVDDDKITLETKGGRHDISKSERSGPKVAWLRTMPANTPMQNANTGLPGQAGMSPEVLQRLRDRGIDPVQAQRFRDQQNGGGGGRNRGQPGNGNNNNNNGARGGGPGGPVGFNAVNGAMIPAAAAQTTRRQPDSDASIRGETAN